MVLVTVVGESQCRKGFEFVFGGPLPECRDCKVKNVCFHLEEGKWYRVTEVRDVHHDCKVHEGGVRVVEVERIPTKAALKSSAAIEGAMLTFEESDCDRRGCEHYRLCHPVGATEGMRYRVVSVEKDEIECPEGRKLNIVLLD